MGIVYVLIRPIAFPLVYTKYNRGTLISLSITDCLTIRGDHELGAECSNWIRPWITSSAEEQVRSVCGQKVVHRSVMSRAVDVVETGSCPAETSICPCIVRVAADHRLPRSQHLTDPV